MCWLTSGRPGAVRAGPSAQSSNAARRHTRTSCTPKAETEAETELAAALGIQAIPTIMAFWDGVLVHRQPGAMPPAALEDLITRVKELDMAEVSMQAVPGRARGLLRTF